VYPGAVLILVLAAAALMAARGARRSGAIRLLAAASATLLFIALIGVSFRLLLALPPLVEISFPALLALLLLTYALVVSCPDEWLLDTLTSQRPGAVMIRRLLLAALLLPLVIAWVEVAGEGSKFLDSTFGAV